MPAPFTAQRQLIFWSLSFAAFLLLVYIFKSVLLPFVLGMVIAYLLNPAVNALGRAKLSRGPASLLILSIFALVVAALMAVIVPLAYRELVELSENFPVYIEKLMSFIQPVSDRIEAYIGEKSGEDLRAMAGDNAGTAAAMAGAVAGGIAHGAQALLHFFTVLVITPIVAYFMMKEWPRITAWVTDQLPRRDKKTILDLLAKIDRKLSGFIRGQLTVALVLGIFYAAALAAAGLQYGFLIGLCAGFLSVIPMVGSTIGLLVSIAVAWFQTGAWELPVIVGSIFLFGQLVEGNFLTPKIVGDRVGLHPLWIFFALMAGGSLFGVLGMLIAVPVAAVASVLIAFGLQQYKASPYYTGGK